MIHSFYVFGANTDVGKTVFSGILMKAAGEVGKPAHYLKPVQTGFPQTNDGQWVKDFSGATSCQTGVTFPEPISPHRCKQTPAAEISDAQLLEQCKEWLNAIRPVGNALAIIEGAGGVLSPTPAGSLAADVYRALRLPVILVGDPKLGGISCTLAAHESLRMRGFEVAMIALFRGEHENADFLKHALRHTDTVVQEFSFSFADFPKMREAQVAGALQRQAKRCLELLQTYYFQRAQRVAAIESVAQRHFWWPFTQHALSEKVTVVDSAFGGSIVTAQAEADGMRTQEFFDGSASWWTLGVGHGEPRTAAAIGSALGRYGHILFPEQAHEPAARLAETIITELGGGKASRVFFSDNGSTAVEVALKMAFRIASTRGVLAPEVRPRVIGLQDSYHGDTLGAVNASSPNIFKKSDRWYVPSGRWLAFPQVAMVNGTWRLLGFDSNNSAPDRFTREFGDASEVFKITDRIQREAATFAAYGDIIAEVFKENELHDIGAVLIEPVVHGSAGMIFVDPLFHYALVRCAQAVGIPVVFDEVFSGIWRFGSPSAAQLLGVHPDISCFSKTLTGGTLPLSVTLSNEEAFNAFRGESKASALLHGHSYTAHPAGCAAACESFRIYGELKRRQDLMTGYWDPSGVRELSRMPQFSRTVALGTVLAMELRSENAGYASRDSRQLVSRVAEAGIQMRPLGNVVYLMTHPTSAKSTCDAVLQKFINVTKEMR